MKQPTTQERVHENLLKELREISDFRYKNDLDEDRKKMRRPLPVSEVTRMIPNADNWEGVKEELKTKPRKKNE